ncbi:MAG: GAF domain-containing protein [Anaerolineae bacterium]
MRDSIRARLILAFIGLAVGPLLVVGALLAWQSFTVLEQQALTLQQEAAKRVASQVAAFFQELENELRFTVQTQFLGELDQDQQQSILANLLAYESAFEEIRLLNSQGQEVAGVYRVGLAPTAPEQVDRSQADEFVIPQTTGQIYYGPIRYDQTTNEPVITIAVPVVNLRTGLVDNVLVSVARIKTVWDLIASIQVSPGQSVYIVAAEEKVVAHRNPSVVLRGTTFAVPEQGGVQAGLNGERVVLAFETLSLGQQQFNIVAEQTIAEALALAFNTILISAGLIVVTLVLAVVISLVAVRQIVRPIQALAATAQAISAGDLSQQVEIERQDELGVLADAFNSMTMQMQSLISGLEQRVAERTNELENRSRYLQASAEVSRATSVILETDQLIRQTVDLIRQRFGLYYVGLFLVDELGEWAVLRAGTGEAGQKMLARGHKLQIGGGSMVGWSIANAQPRIAQVAAEDAVRLATTELPDTRSEAALPLRTRGGVIGAVTVQSDRPGVFDEATLAVLQIMADQVANAIENARLFAESQTALETAREAYGELSRQGWLAMLQANRELGFRFARSTVTPAEGEWQPEMLRAVKDGQSVIGNDTAQPTLTIPLKVRDQVVGVLDLQRDTPDRPWTDADQVLVETLAEQLGVALESARLYQDTQRRAAQERLIGEVTGRIRESLDIETVLRTTASEIRQALDLDTLVIRLATPDNDDTSGLA